VQKTVFRKKIIDERLALSGSDVREKSLSIERRFLQFPLYKKAESVALYCDFRGEVRTDILLEDALASGKTVLMPRIRQEDFSISFFSIASPGELAENDIGFKEPPAAKGRKWDVSDIDLFVVPGVAFDRKGNRLGMGKGCYDRALCSIAREKIVGLAYEFQLVEDVPSYHHDVKIGWIITENKITRTIEIN